MRIIHFLNWDIESITSYLDCVKDLNFDTIQINPVQPFIDVPGYEWWATYQPLDFKIGNIYGTKDDLIKLCSEAEKRNIKIIVDVITNHLANDGVGKEIIPNKNINSYIRDNKDFWKKHSKIYGFNSYKDIIEESIGLPGLNLKNEDLQKIILKFLDDLRKCGVSGFRFDAAKHIGLPSDGVTYFERIKEFLDKNNLIGYAEILDGPAKINTELLEKKDEFSKLMYVLTEEDSLVSDKSKKITFIESHDTYLNENGHTKNLTTKEVIEKYYELTKKYENTLFYVRDRSMGKRLFTKNHNRCGWQDTTWINCDILRQANLYKGNEFAREKIEKEIKESDIMENKDELMELHHELSMKIHEILIKQLDDTSTIKEYTNLILLDYRLQTIINDMLGITPFDNFLIDCTMGEFYKQKWNTYPLSAISYPNFCKEVLTTMKKTIVNHNVTDGINEKIKKLSN